MGAHAPSTGEARTGVSPVARLRFRRGRDDSGERGATAIELAFVLPILVLLLFGIVEFSITYNRVQALHAAAREGARLASQPYVTSSEVKQRVEDALEGVKFQNPVAISVSPSGGQPCNLRSGESVEVSVEVDDEIDIPLWPTGPMTVHLTGKGEFRCE